MKPCNGVRDRLCSILVNACTIYFISEFEPSVSRYKATFRMLNHMNLSQIDLVDNIEYTCEISFY